MRVVTRRCVAVCVCGLVELVTTILSGKGRLRLLTKSTNIRGVFATDGTSCSMMNTPVPLQVKRKNVRQIRRHRCLKRADPQGTKGQLWMIKQSDHKVWDVKVTMPPTTVIQQKEMASYFQLLDDEWIWKFLEMDSCYRIADKYLLAMTFVYFKRASFTCDEYTRKNFFIALYLANTMEEEEEESKYEIFPWALGKNWRRQFPRFLKQRDKLWARIQYRAAVSRRCCEEVMAIVSSHTVWQRQRSDHHSGAQRKYNDQGLARFPRGPSASPLSCTLCHCGSRLHHGAVSFSAPRSSAAQTMAETYKNPFLSVLSLEITPPQTAVSYYNAAGTKSQAGPEDSIRDASSCKSSYDTLFDWINEM